MPLQFLVLLQANLRNAGRTLEYKHCLQVFGVSVGCFETMLEEHGVFVFVIIPIEQNLNRQT